MGRSRILHTVGLDRLLCREQLAGYEVSTAMQIGLATHVMTEIASRALHQAHVAGLCVLHGRLLC